MSVGDRVSPRRVSVPKMTSPIPQASKISVRLVQFSDLEALENLAADCWQNEQNREAASLQQRIAQIRPWYGLLKFLSLFPNPCRHRFHAYVAEQQGWIRGAIQVSPFNSSRSTWRCGQVLVDRQTPNLELLTGRKSIGSQLLRHCLETIWEARTWLVEVNINDKKALGLYRENGFQPLAEMTYWTIDPATLQQLAQETPDLPNLLPVSNADATLLHQLDTVAMPPLLRQVFDRHILDFKTSFLAGLLLKLQQWFGDTRIFQGYVFEPQRKAAIGYYYQLDLSSGDSSGPHQASLTVHPAYTWLYPQLMSQMAGIIQNFPPQSLELVSADFQPEREEYLEQLGATPREHTLLMSRSVWHKLRETKPLEALQLSEVLQGLQPARTPIPSRMSWSKYISETSKSESTDNPGNKNQG